MLLAPLALGGLVLAPQAGAQELEDPPTTSAQSTSTTELAPVVPLDAGETNTPETDSEKASRLLDIVVIALVALAIIIAIATVIFWRRSKPAAVSAESALAGDDASATGSGLAAGSAWADTDQPTPDPDSPFAQAPRPLPEPAPQPDPAGAAPEPLEVASAATLAAATASLVPDAENDAKSADVPASRDEAAEESPSEPSESAHAAAGDTWLASDFQERLTDEPPERAEPPPFSED